MRRLILLLICTVMLMTACAKNEDEYYVREIYSMDTVINVNVDPNVKNVETVCNEVVYYIYELEKDLSATVADGDLVRFNASVQPYTLSPDLLEAVRQALDIAHKTEGRYDPTVLPLTELWNITEGGHLPTEAEIVTARSQVDYTALTLEGDVLSKSSAVRLDLGGIAKGYALGRVVDMLCDRGVGYGMISFGGNVGVFGQKPDGTLWEIGIKDPFDTDSVIGKIRTSSGYVAVSGDYERYFEQNGKKYHHIFDPQSGYPVDNGLRSVAVYTEDATLGDALSTALFVMGYDRAIEFYNSGIYDFEALFITDDEVLMTKGMEEMFTYEN